MPQPRPGKLCALGTTTAEGTQNLLEPGVRRYQTATGPNVLLLLPVRDVRNRLRQVRPAQLLVWTWGREVHELEAGVHRHGTQLRPARRRCHQDREPGIHRGAAAPQRDRGR